MVFDRRNPDLIFFSPFSLILLCGGLGSSLFEIMAPRAPPLCEILKNCFTFWRPFITVIFLRLCFVVLPCRGAATCSNLPPILLTSSDSAFILSYTITWHQPISTDLLMSSCEDDRADVLVSIITNCNNSFFDNNDDDSAVFEADLLIDFENNINNGCRGFSSLSWECKSVRREIECDLSFIDSVERNLGLEMLRAKLEIRRAMRGDNPNPFRVFPKLTRAERRSALTRVKERVRKLREGKKQKQSPCKHKKEPVTRVSKLKKPIKHMLLSEKHSERKAVRPLRPKNVY
jgi:hypothetical protein